jgi:hypothetical protein
MTRIKTKQQNKRASVLRNPNPPMLLRHERGSVVQKQFGRSSMGEHRISTWASNSAETWHANVYSSIAS